MEQIRRSLGLHLVLAIAGALLLLSIVAAPMNP